MATPSSRNGQKCRRPGSVRWARTGIFFGATDEGVRQLDFPQGHPDIGAGAFDKDAAGVGVSHPLEAVDKGLGAEALLAAAGFGGIRYRSRHSKTHINWLKLWVFACLEFEEKMNLRRGVYLGRECVRDGSPRCCSAASRSLHAVGKAPHVLDNRTGQTPSCAP